MISNTRDDLVSREGFWLHRYAVAVAFLTLLLVIAGGLVTSNDAGLSVPDWPLSYGKLMPPMEGGIFYEHGHRMVASTVGLLTVVLAIWLWRSEKRKWLRMLGLAAVGAVIAQGILGGMTVLFLLPKAVSISHACLGQLFFSTTVCIAFFTSSFWKRGAQITESGGNPPLHWLAVAAAFTVFVQLALGASARHHFLGIVPHVIGALFATGMVLWITLRVLMNHADHDPLRRPALALLAVTFLQIFLGIAAYMSRVVTSDAIQPMPLAVTFTVAHVAVGALVLASSILLVIQVFRHVRRPLRDWTFSDYIALTKPNVTWLILMSAGVGYFFGLRGASLWSLNWWSLGHTIMGTALIASGTAALNQWFEREADRKMRRTSDRPLPAGRLTAGRALAFGIVLSVLGFSELAFGVNRLSGLLGLGTLLAYLFLYTPLKQRSPLSTTIGAFPGAMPPMIGYAAASGALHAEAWVLFAILFLWQFPHFYAIAWMYREDYARAGILMLPVVEPDGASTARQIVLFSLTLIPVSLAPSLLGMSGKIYLVGALALGLFFLYSGVRVAFERTILRARRVLLVSVIYLPLIYGLMLLDRPWL